MVVSLGENAELSSQVSSLTSDLATTKEELRRTEIKLTTIMEYFQQKELDLHSKLEAGEQNRRQIESLVSEAEGKEKKREEDREMQRQELENLKAQMKEIEASYFSQTKNHERRAEECAVSGRSVHACAVRKIMLSCAYRADGVYV